LKRIKTNAKEKEKVMVSRKTLIGITVLLLCGTSVSQAEFFYFQQGLEDPCHPGSGIYEGGHDLTIGSVVGWAESNPDRLRMRYASGNEVFNALVKFEGIEEQIQGLAVIEASITLTFQHENVAWKPATIDIYPALKPWNDPNCNWNFSDIDLNLEWDLPGAQDPNDRGELISSIFMGPRQGNPVYQNYVDGGQYEFALDKSTVQNWIDDPASNYGVIMVMKDDQIINDVTFSSNEDTNASFHPMLTVTTSTCWGYYEADLNEDCYVNLIDYAMLSGQWLDDLRADIAPYGGDNIVGMPDLQLMANQWLLEATGGQTLTADLDGDGKVNLYDYALLANQWLTQKTLTVDIAPAGGDKKIDLLDLQVMANQWLKCSNLLDANCY
jgi:hypothetical protein